MTTRRLQDLLHERVADLEPVDLAARAWSDATRTRRRRSGATVVASVAAIVLVAGGAWWAGRPDASTGPSVDPATSAAAEPTPSGSRGPSNALPVEPWDVVIDGHPAWLAPASSEQTALEPYAVLSGNEAALPPAVDLADDATRGEAAGTGPAVAVWAIGDEDVVLRRVVVLDSNGWTWDLDVSRRLDPVADAHGNSRTPLGALRLDGDKVFFIQRDSVEVYDFAQGWWSSVPTEPFLAEGARWVGDDLWVPDELGGTTGTRYSTGGARLGRLTIDPVPQPWTGLDAMAAGEPVLGPGEARSAGFFSVPTLDEPIEGWASTELIAVRDGEDLSMLVFSFADEPPRSKLCCPLVGWLDEDWVGFASSGDVLAWRPGSGDVALVSQVTGLQRGEHASPAFASLLP